MTNSTILPGLSRSEEWGRANYQSSLPSSLSEFLSSEEEFATMFPPWCVTIVLYVSSCCSVGIENKTCCLFRVILCSKRRWSIIRFFLVMKLGFPNRPIVEEQIEAEVSGRDMITTTTANTFDEACRSIDAINRYRR